MAYCYTRPSVMPSVIPADSTSKSPVILGVRYFMTHTPGMVQHGSKPSRDIAADPELALALTPHLRLYEEAVAYPPNRAFLGDIYPNDLAGYPQPWYEVNGAASRWSPHGEIMPEDEFYCLLKIFDVFDLLWLEEGFVNDVAARLAKHPLLSAEDIERLGTGHPNAAIESRTADTAEALALHLSDGRLIGCIARAHADDANLTPGVLLENLACKASAVMALRTLLDQKGWDADGIDYVINSGEEAVGERYQRGGGNLGKAIAEACACNSATGADVKAFCCGPVHALVMAAALVNSGVYLRVAVVAGCSLAKLGMKYRGHLDHG